MKKASTLSMRAEKAIFKNDLRGAIWQYRNKQVIYSQGKAGDTLFYIRDGCVMLTIRAKGRRLAVLAMLGAGEFFGQACLAGVPRRACTATAIGTCTVVAIKKKEMIRILRGDRVAAKFFVSYLVSVIKKHQEHLVDLLVNSAEQRLARVLLQISQSSGKEGRIPKINQGDLANMVGTTRSRINLLMNRFRKRGFVSYNGELEVHSALRSYVLAPRGA
jgi:CRP/FNR family transcriptional regulator, cyclic AMP receptor protein